MIIHGKFVSIYVTHFFGLDSHLGLPLSKDYIPDSLSVE